MFTGPVTLHPSPRGISRGWQEGLNWVPSAERLHSGGPRSLDKNWNEPAGLVTDPWSTCAGLPLRRWCLCSRGGHPPRDRSGHPEEIRLRSQVHPPRRTELSDLCCPCDSGPDKQKMPTIRKEMFAYHRQNEKKVRVSFGSVITERSGTYFGGGIDSLSEWLL